MDAIVDSFVGIDVAKDSLDVCLLLEGRRFTTSNDRTGFRQVLDELPTVESASKSIIQFIILQGY